MPKSVKEGDWFYMETGGNVPQSTTHEMLEKGIMTKSANKSSQPSLIERINAKKLIVIPEATSYARDYAPPNDICAKETLVEDTPDRLFNRLPLNDFAFARLTASEFKFMDDHFINVSEGRKKINFFRQIRNQHFHLV